MIFPVQFFSSLGRHNLIILQEYRKFINEKPILIRAMEIITVTVSPFLSNCHILVCKDTKEAIIIDAGDEKEKILAPIIKNQWKVKFLINTHAHVDHTSAVAAIQQELAIPFYLHEKEKIVLDNLLASQQMYGFGDGTVPIPEVINPLETLPFGNHEITIIETPGHSPGGICLLVDEHLFAGDTLFDGSIGRTDLLGGSMPVLLQSIAEKLLVLDENTIVHCGHGPNTTIGKEKRTNPFLQT